MMMKLPSLLPVLNIVVVLVPCYSRPEADICYGGSAAMSDDDPRHSQPPPGFSPLLPDVAPLPLDRGPSATQPTVSPRRRQDERPLRPSPPAPPRESHQGHRARLRARFLRSGLQGLADYEIVELLLTLAIPRSDVKPQAKQLIQRFGTVRAILDASIDELQAVVGLGDVAPVALKLIREVAGLYLQQVAEGQPAFIDRERLAEFWRLRIGALPYEVFEVAYLDAGYRLLRDGVERLEEGTVDRAAVYPRTVIAAALRRNAAAIVLAHNHPNSRVQPSEQDKTLTRAIELAASTVQLRVFDHLIISADATFSFRQEGLL